VGSVERARLVWGTVQTVGVVGALLIDWATGGFVATAALFTAAMVVSVLEFCSMAAPAAPHRLWAVVGVLLLGAGPLVGWRHPALDFEYSLVALLAFLLTLFALDYRRDALAKSLNSVATTAVGVLYVGGLLTFVTRLGSLPASGACGVALLLAVAKGADIAAYFTGTRLGRHKLAPQVSPNKTVEGAVGALLVSMALAWGLSRLFGLGLGTGAALLFGGLVGVAAQVGDLAESFIKRKLKVKDSAQLLVGFGGILDIVDSVMGAAPVAYLFFRLHP